ncbi:hypothetical protein [Methylorubrum populi]|uniref:hypothetical protein n=1 Tax=Methylorubrum populi TaxID=223967 RepID=UPI003F65761B
MTTTNRTAELGFAGKPARASSIIAPVASDAERGSPGFGEFVLDLHKDGESLSIFLTVEREDGDRRTMPVSVAFPASKVRDLLDRRPEVPESETVEPDA